MSTSFTPVLDALTKQRGVRASLVVDAEEGITVDANRNASKPAVVIEVKDGKKTLNTTTYPQTPAS